MNEQLVRVKLCSYRLSLLPVFHQKNGADFLYSVKKKKKDAAEIFRHTGGSKFLSNIQSLQSLSLPTLLM